MRILGLDYGEKRIGIALSDELGWTAQTHSVLTRTNLEEDLESIIKICRDNEVKEIVLGFPKNMNGTIGPKAMEVQKFGDILCETSSLPIIYFDERLSTVSAEKLLIKADVSRKKRKKVIDKIAAAHILQNYLDGRKN
ncbi:MAG TPA: Holliday junction resolvase RuvX [Syntrophomonadaceae bacterium]|nr:Holliday junction resolvase RuvX [Syntrophomonadaceae bacterium]